MPSNVVSCDWLKNNLDDSQVKVLDVTHTMKPKRDWIQFKNGDFGNFPKLMAENIETEYVISHIPGAMHFNLDVAFYPSQWEKSSLYAPELFQTYIKMLGINNDDHVVLYSRGPASGMLFASRAWWTFKLYGFHNVTVLNGGFSQWTKLGYPVDGILPTPPLGNFIAKPINEKFLITFDELNSKNQDGESLFTSTEKINYIDARSSDQFTGNAPLGFPAKDATGSHIKGAINFPLSKVVDENGLKNNTDITQALLEADIKTEKPIIIACGGGIQACVIFLALLEIGHTSRVYNGSMVEIAARASHLIAE